MRLSDKKWLIEQTQFQIDGKYETCFNLANGYMGVRGTFEDNHKTERLGTFVAGVFNKSEAQVGQLVNLPYFMGLKFYINNEYLDIHKCKVLDYYRALDMKQSLLYTSMLVEDEQGRQTRLEGYRFLSMANQHLVGLSYTFTPQNYSADITVESCIDGSTTNMFDNPWERVKHYEVVNKEVLSTGAIYLEAKTREDKYEIGMATKLKVSREGNNVANRKRCVPLGEIIAEYAEFSGVENQKTTIEKYVSVVTTRDENHISLKDAASNMLRAFYEESMDRHLEASIDVMKGIWKTSNITIEGDPKAELALRFNMYALATLVNETDNEVSIAAKGLHGEWYNGHVFWDTEIFVLPYYIYNNPKAARTLLEYRYNKLDAARKNAAINGYKGARFPWESADSGKEETPRWGFDYKGNIMRIWPGDIEYHITSDISFAIWQYFRATNDIDFMQKYGAEIYVETARFWASRVEYNKEQDRYEINCVIGPDEFHEHVNNNLYTNYFARWNMLKAIEVLEMLQKDYSTSYEVLCHKLSFNKEEIQQWKEVIDKIYIPIKDENGVFEQNEGFFDLEDYVITKYDSNNMPVFPDEVNIVELDRYTLVKQADVMMLLYLLGEEFSDEAKAKNFEYYEARTMHKSSLSPSTYCIMGLKVNDHKKAYEYLMRTALVDLEDNQGNTYQGIHAASTGGTWQAAVFGFGAMYATKEGKLGCHPLWLPENWESYTFNMMWQGATLEITLTKTHITMTMLEGNEPLTLEIIGQDYILNPNKKLEIKR